MAVNTESSSKIITKLYFKLLPAQVMLSAIGAINGVVSGLFATNAIGAEAMGAIGLYSPVNMVVTTSATVLAGGAAIVTGRYIGRNEQENTQKVFSVDLFFSIILSAALIAIILFFALTDLTIIFSRDDVVRNLFNQYLIGMAIGILPLILGQQLSIFLSLENQVKRIFIASIAYIITNLIMCFLFVQKLKMEALGLALATAVGLWVYFLVQFSFYLSGKSVYRIRYINEMWHELKEVMVIGSNGAMTYIYQILRGFIVNALLISYVGSMGLSAFTTANSFLGLFWAVPAGMLSVSRMFMSVNYGEEDKNALVTTMKIAMYKCIPLQCAISLLIILLAYPITNLYFRDVSNPVYMMTVWGFRLLPVCMPLAIVLMHFTCFNQVAERLGIVNIYAILDGVLFVAGFSAILIPFLGVNAVYIANILNGVGCIVAIVIYSMVKRKKIPANMEDLMVIPEGFGVPDEDRLDISIKTMEEVIGVSEKIGDFCLSKKIDKRRANLAGLFMEEMSGNVVDHGFKKDDKKHSVDVRAAYKDDELILCIKDDCIPFDPATRKDITDPEDITKNIGIRMVYKLAKSISYQNILGLNVLNIRV